MEENHRDKNSRKLPIPQTLSRSLSASPTRNKSSSLEKPRKTDKMNEKVNLCWKGAVKETRSARLRREMNAGKGGLRSISASNEDLAGISGGTEWLRNKLFEQKKQINFLESDIEDLKKQKKSVEDSLSERDLHIAKLRKNVDEKLKLIETESNEKKNVESEMLKFKTKSNDLELQVKHQKEANEKDQIQLKGLEKKLHTYEEIMKKTADDFNTERESMKQTNDHLTNDLTQCKTDIQKLAKEKEDLLKSVQQENDENSRLKEKVSNVEEDLAAVKNKKRELEKMCKKYENDLTERIKESLSMLEEIDQLKAITNQYKTQLNENYNTIDKQKNALQQKQYEIDDLNESRIRLGKTITNEIGAKEKLKTKIGEYELEINDHKKCIENFTLNLNEKNDTIKNLMVENNVVKVKIGENNQQIESLEQKLTRLESQIRDYEIEKNNTFNCHEMEIERYKNEIEESQTKRELLERECDEERVLRDSIRGKNEKYKIKIDELKENLVNSVKGMNDKVIVVNNLMDENNFLKENLTQHKKEVSELRSDLENMADQNKRDKERFENERIYFKEQTIDFENQIKQYRDMITTLKNEVQKYTDIINDKSEKMKAMQTELRCTKEHFENEMSKQSIEIKSLKIELNEKNADLKCLEDGNKKMSSVLSQYDQNFQEKEHVIEEMQLKIKELTKSVEKLNGYESVVKKQAKQIEEMKATHDYIVAESQQQLDELKKEHDKKVNDLQDELDMSVNKSKEEMNELLNNFSELENEFGFCQDELNLKVAKTKQLRKEIEFFKKNFELKEKQFRTELETINEQNETILENEIIKHRTETDEVVIELKQKHFEEINATKLQYQTRIIEEIEKAEQDREQTKTEYQQKTQQFKIEREEIMKTLTRNEHEMKTLQLNLKTALIEVESKSRISEKLTHRIQTQQKLIDYLMKSLAQERNCHGVSSKDNISKSSHLQQQQNLGERLFNPPYDTDVPIITMMSNSTPLQITSEKRLTSLTSASNTFLPLLTSSPQSNRYLNKTVPAIPHDEHVHNYLSNSVDRNYQSRSLPENFDQGYHSPSHETNTLSFYFAEQIKCISNTFDKIKRLDGAQSAGDQISLEMWKQKIHYRLKVLEDQLSEMDTSSSTSGSSTKSNNDFRYNSITDLNSTNIMFHPTTNEIRLLIENVNKKYENLNKKCFE